MGGDTLLKDMSRLDESTTNRSSWEEFLKRKLQRLGYERNQGGPHAQETLLWPVKTTHTSSFAASAGNLDDSPHMLSIPLAPAILRLAVCRCMM